MNEALHRDHAPGLQITTVSRFPLVEPDMTSNRGHLVSLNVYLVFTWCPAKKQNYIADL